jgi:hypothetical protein
MACLGLECSEMGLGSFGNFTGWSVIKVRREGAAAMKSMDQARKFGKLWWASPSRTMQAGGDGASERTLLAFDD